jgi:hypothetical protein
MIRTETGAAEYVAMADRAGLVEVSCVPYNPYHQVYRSEFWEQRVLVPAYRAYYRLSTRLRSQDVLRTWPWSALCLLLQGSKQTVRG